MNPTFNCEIAEKFIIENQDKLSADRIHAELSYNMYAMARQGIKDIFNNEDMSQKMSIIGYTTNYNRSHILYCSKNGIHYILYNYQGTYNDVQYFTRAKMMDYFKDHENEAPEFSEIDFVRDSLHMNNYDNISDFAEVARILEEDFNREINMNT
jgi:hypothetical protein